MTAPPSAQRLDIFRGILRDLPRLPLADLGAGHCKFSRIAHEMGFPVVSIDVRKGRVPDDIAWPFLQQDVREVDLSPFEIVCILGLLYHLPVEEQVRLLFECSGKLVIVDTHCADRAEVESGPFSGRYFQEVLTAPTAAWGNATSFWHTEDSLRKLFSAARFTAEKIFPEHAPLRSFWVLRPA